MPVLETASPDSSHSSVHAVRRFNRFYTHRVGVLQEHLLQSQFSLTEVRVLYELAHRGNLTAGELRLDLGLDRGYLSRMLQKFEKAGYLRTCQSPQDRRRIFLSLTTKGKKVFEPLDRRSSDEVSKMLAQLSPEKQKTLLGALRDVEDVLSPESRPSKAYVLRQHKPGDMGWVAQRHGEIYWQEYKYDDRFEALVAGIVAQFIENIDPARERCWIAERDGERVGSIFLVKKSKAVAKLRLLLVEPSARGLGVGKKLIEACVNFARDAGYKKIVLWTQSELHAARHLYQQAGFQLAAESSHESWSRTNLVAQVWELSL